LAKHQQLWLDVDEEALFAYGTEEGLRHIADRVGRALGWPVSGGCIGCSRCLTLGAPSRSRIHRTR